MIGTAFKWIGLSMAAVALALAGVYFWMARDRGPTHPALAAADMAPIIPLRDLWANNDSEWGYTISPGKGWVSWRAVDVATPLIRLRRRDDDRVTDIETTQGATYWWDHDDRHLHLRQYADERWAVWKIGARNPRDDWVDVTPRGFRHWRVLHRLPDSDARIFITTRDRDAQYDDLYTVEPDGHGKRLERWNPGHVTRWFVDTNGRIRARVVNTGPGAFAIEFDEDGDDEDWRSAFTFTARDTLRPGRLSGTDDSLTAFSDKGRDKIALIRIDLDTGEETVLMHDPNLSIARWFGLGALWVVPDVLEIGNGHRRYEPMTERGEKLMEALADLKSPYHFSVGSSSEDGEIVTLATNEREDGWRYRLVDLSTGEVEHLGAHDMTRHAARLPETLVDTVTARDGLEIPILLTLPKNVPPENLPMVAVIHGGPANHDRWVYNRTSIFLADRGYAVLRVNYRGSTGFGRRHQRAGDHEYGRAMQDDIVDAVQAMVERGVADPDHIAIMGASWGGYSALMGVARDPDLFAAAISIAGVTDVEYQTVHAPHFWGIDKTYWTQIAGDPENPDHRAEMREHSPLTLVENIKVPVMLAHGIKDRVVDRSDTERFAKRLQELGTPHETHYFEREGHSLSRWQTKVLLMRGIEKFLARHLGGRDGGFDYVELAAEYL